MPMRFDVGSWMGRALRGVHASRWGVVVTLASSALFLWMFSTGPYARNAGRSDGYYTWLFARSIAYDHDIDFTNDYALCGDPAAKGILRGTHHPDNPFYIGPSIAWVPVLSVVRHVVP